MISIDPSIRAMGWADFLDDKVVYCGLVRSKAKLPEDAVRDQLSMFIKQCHSYPKKLVIELPQVYDPKKWKGDPNDLIWVSVLCGALIGHFSKADTLIYRPAQWKGQLPKEVVQMRVEETLSQEEIDLVLWTMNYHKYPNYLRHNIWEAIGLGLVALNRLHVVQIPNAATNASSPHDRDTLSKLRRLLPS